MKIYKSRLFIHLWYKNQWEKEKVIFNSHVPFACLCQRIVNETGIHLLHVLLFLDIDWFSFSRVSWLFIINKTGCFFHITSVCCFYFCCRIVEFNSNLCSLNSLISFCFSRVLLKWWRVEKKLIYLIWNPDVMHMECPLYYSFNPDAVLHHGCPLYDNLQHWSG